MDSYKRSKLGGILELPEEILHHILSFLDEKESARTCVLAKPWFTAWLTRPVLRFEEYNLWRKGFLNHINRTLVRYQEQQTTIQYLRIRVKYFKDFYFLNNFIQRASKCGVKKLDLYLSSVYGLPSLVFEVESLEDLSCSSFCRSKLQIPEKVLCSRLKRLSLSYIFLDDLTLHNIISSCPIIETLDLKSLRGLENCKILCPNLKRLHIQIKCESIEVESFDLELLDCCFGSIKPGDLNLKASRSLKCLKVNHIDNADKLFYNFNHKFPNLEDLTIQDCPLLKFLKVSNQSLKKLDLKDNFDLKQLWVDCPNIIQFYYNSHERMLLPDSLSFNTNYLSRRNLISDIRIQNMEHISCSSWFCSFKKFLEKIIPCRSSMVIDLFEYAHYMPIIEMPHIHRLTLGIGSMQLYADFSNFLDGIFSTYRPILIRQYLLRSSSDIEFRKLLFEKLKMGSCDSRENRGSWKKDLKELKIEISEWNRDQRRWEREVEFSEEKTLLNIKSSKEQVLVFFHLKWEKS